MKRTVKKILVISMLLIVFPFLRTFAFEFEDYQWGKPVNEVIKKLQDKKKIFSYSELGLSYKDKILNEPCEVFLFFSPKSKELAFISISWSKSSVYEKLKELFTKEYGEPYNITENMYFWLGPKRALTDSIYFSYGSRGARLIYFGGEYYEKFNTEKREIYSK